MNNYKRALLLLLSVFYLIFCSYYILLAKELDGYNEQLQMQSNAHIYHKEHTIHENISQNCRFHNLECLDKAATKNIDGTIFYLQDICRDLSLQGESCCWNLAKKYSCMKPYDNCVNLRKNPNCQFVQNTCLRFDDFNPSQCIKYQSTYSCASRYMPNIKKICGNSACANNDNGTIAAKCYLPEDAKTLEDSTKERSDSLANITKILMSKKIGDQLGECRDIRTCKLFKGKYRACVLWNAITTNNGRDCGINRQEFNISLVDKLNDKDLYGTATTLRSSDAGKGILVGESFNYELSENNQDPVNKSIARYMRGHKNMQNIINQDMDINYLKSSNYYKIDDKTEQKISVKNYNIDTVSIKPKAKFGRFMDYLSSESLQLAWDKLKSTPNPLENESIKYEDIGIVRRPDTDLSWSNRIPHKVSGLCVNLSNYCSDGNKDGSALIRKLTGMQLACGKLKYRDILHPYILQPKEAREEWCCFNSKFALYLNLAAYDQMVQADNGDIFDFYLPHISKYQKNGNVARLNGACGGISMSQMSKIDFTKAPYLQNILSTKQIIDKANQDGLKSPNAQNNLQIRNINNMIKKIKNNIQ